jgi:putative ABC transport system permease protein
MLQYLIESATMALGGGFIGVIAGVAFAKAITLIIGFPSEIELWSVALGLFVATVVGIFFGVYPARKASLLRSHCGPAFGAVKRWRNEARGHQ